MQDVSVVIPFRGADAHRIANLQKVFGYLHATLKGAEFLIIEQDDASLIRDLPELRPARLKLMRDAGPFNKAKLLNLGARHASRDILLMCDADMIISGEALERTIAVIRKDLEFVRPYEHLIDLDANATGQYLSDELTPHSEPSLGDVAPSDRSQFGEQLCLAGGVFAIRKNAYERLGGFDERFMGWGGEDNAFSDLVQRHVPTAAVYRGGVAWHLWHPRSNTTEHEHYQDNVALMTQLRSALINLDSRAEQTERESKAKYKAEDD